jgi:effector-binding domain-containing protein
MGCEKCCPKIKKKDWDFKKHDWKNTAFYTKGFFQIFHMPLNIGSAISKGFKELENKGYKMKSPYIILQEETGFLKGRVLFKLDKKPKEKDSNLIVLKKATLYSKYYKGEFRGLSKAFKELMKFLEKKKLEPKQFFTWTVDCPECWKERGGPTNVIFARV